MTEQFLEQNCVPHEIAKSLKDIGFDKECMAFWGNNGSVFEMEYYDQECTNSELENGCYYIKREDFQKDCTAPLFQQVFDWFQGSHIYGHTDIECIGSDEWAFVYCIKHLPRANQNDKRRFQYFVETKSFSDTYPTYSGGWNERQEAQIECIKEMIKIFKSEIAKMEINRRLQ